jgi:hypothetical protein
MKRAKKKRSKKTAPKPWTTADKLLLTGLIIQVILWLLDRLLGG